MHLYAMIICSTVLVLKCTYTLASVAIIDVELFFFFNVIFGDGS